MESSRNLQTPWIVDVVSRLAKLLWPELKSMTEARRLVGLGDVISLLYTLPLAVAGLFWLTAVSDFNLFLNGLPIFLLIFGLITLYSQINYFIIIEIRTDRYGSADGSLASMIQWSAVFIFGPTALWMSIAWQAINFAIRWRKTGTLAGRWNLARNLTLELTITTLAYLLALVVYRNLGGSLPLVGITPRDIFIALLALTVHLVIVTIIWSGYILYHLGIQKRLAPSNPILPILKFFALSLGLPYLSHPFAILAAGLFISSGPVVYLFFVLGFLLVALLARQLSWAAERSRQHSRQIEQLEQLGRALLNAPPDASSLQAVLEQHVPTMFPSGHIVIRLSPDQILLNSPHEWHQPEQSAWQWLGSQTQPQAFLAKDLLPWNNNRSDHHAMVATPIFATENNSPIGGVIIELRALSQPWDLHSLQNLFPALQTLAAQVASALHQAKIYVRVLEYQQLTQELKLAGRIQASFLPNKFPSIPGWQLAVTLLPARDTSGDFFDVIELPEGRLGLLIADVADKGVGPALYMALSRTLLRTYALEFDAEPEVVFYATNARLLQDTRASLFVTAFYGILDPHAGTLTYCNAGHNPPYLLGLEEKKPVRSLGRTGMAIGIEELTTWEQASVAIDPGDTLLLYTDGIPDAQNESGDFFDEERLLEICQGLTGHSAQEVQAAILEHVQNFAGSSPQSDDITLMVLVRDTN